LLDSFVIDRRSELFYLITRKDDPHITIWTNSKFRNECGRVLALKKLPHNKVKDGDEDAPPKYVTKMVPLWGYVEHLRLDLAVVRTYFKPVLILEPLHIQRAKNCFNTFSGFNYKYDPNFKVDESQFDLILRHIHEVWCNDEQNLFDYVTKWMAHIIQRPYKTGVSLLVYSHEHGVGKSMLADWFAKYVIGCANYATAGDMNDLLSRFNSNLENKVLTLIDEVGSHGSTWLDEAKLKKLITQPEYQVELKGQEKRHINDLNNYIFTTNCETPIKIEGTDRQYCVLQCSGKYCGQIPTYFEPLSNQMNNPNSSLHFFHWLAQLPLDTNDYKFNACFELPITDYDGER